MSFPGLLSDPGCVDLRLTQCLAADYQRKAKLDLDDAPKPPEKIDTSSVVLILCPAPYHPLVLLSRCSCSTLLCYLLILY